MPIEKERMLLVLEESSEIFSKEAGHLSKEGKKNARGDFEAHHISVWKKVLLCHSKSIPIVLPVTHGKVCSI